MLIVCGMICETMNVKKQAKNKYLTILFVIVAFAAFEGLMFAVAAKLPKPSVGYCFCTASSKHGFGAYMSKTKNDYLEATCDADCKNNDFSSGIIMTNSPGNSYLVETK